MSISFILLNKSEICHNEAPEKPTINRVGHFREKSYPFYQKAKEAVSEWVTNLAINISKGVG